MQKRSCSSSTQTAAESQPFTASHTEAPKPLAGEQFVTSSRAVFSAAEQCPDIPASTATRFLANQQYLLPLGCGQNLTTMFGFFSADKVVEADLLDFSKAVYELSRSYQNLQPDRVENSPASTPDSTFKTELKVPQISSAENFGEEVSRFKNVGELPTSS